VNDETLHAVPDPVDEPDGADAVPASALEDDPVYRSGVIDLLGVLAYSELVAFERLAADAALAPSIADEAALALMATAEVRHFTRIAERIAELGVDPSEAMAPFRAPLLAFHEQTAPSDWLEGLVKAYVGDGIATDFYREVAELLDPGTRDLVLEVCSDSGHADFAVATVRSAITADPRVAGRLALWGRRLVGEALQQAQQVVAERDGLTAMLVGGVGRPGLGLDGLGELFNRLTEAHTQRMQTLGLQA
jgi:ferritin-like protein